MTTMRTPNEVIQAGRDMVLDGREPVGIDEQIQLMAFIAANVVPDMALLVCRLMTTLYPDYFNLLTEVAVDKIVAYEHGR